VLTELLFSVDEFRSSDLCAAVAAASPKRCDHYSRVFLERKNLAEQAGDDIGRRVFGFFHHVCFLWLKPDDKRSPLSVAMSSVNGWRSAAVSDFSEGQIRVLEDLVDDLDDAELRARVADLIWMYQHKGNLQFAEKAVDAYLESGGRLLFADDLSFGVERLSRALHLAASLGRNSRQLHKAIEVLGSLIEQYAPTQRPSLKLLLDLLFEFGRERPLEYARIAESHAQHQETLNQWPYARGSWETAIHWYRASGDAENVHTCLKRISECWVQEAESSLAGNKKTAFSIAASHLQSAIEALRRVPGTETQRQALHKRMLALQAQSVGEFGAISYEVDLTQIVERAVEAVKCSTLREAVFALCLLSNPPKVADLRYLTEKMMKDDVFYSLIAWQSVDDQGRVVVRRDSYLGSSHEEQEGALRAEMHRQARMQEGATGRIIEIVRRQILFEHWPQLEDFLAIASYSPFVRPDRELIFARGLLSGIEGDYLVALHLLVPQIEDSLRYLLERQGVVTSKLSADGIQEVIDLNDLLRLPELLPILGEDLVFELEGLLIDRFGSNFRNKLAHGLLYSSEFQTDQATYLWWNILRLCCIPLIKFQTENADAQAGGS
jgi:hypothetical protein